MEKGCFVLKDKSGQFRNTPYLSREIGEVILKSGNSISTGAFASFGFWDIDVLVMTQRGRPVAMLRSLDDDSYVQTRIAQYQASLDERAYSIAKSFIIAKLESQNVILRNMVLEPHLDNFREIIEESRPRVSNYSGEDYGHRGKAYSEILSSRYSAYSLRSIRPEKREGFMAYDGMNNRSTSHMRFWLGRFTRPWLGRSLNRTSGSCIRTRWLSLA